MSLITLDFETYYDRDYSLSKMTTEAYIRDPRFQVIGVGVKVDAQPAMWYPGEFVKRLLTEMIQWDDKILLCHHTAFDGAILSWRYGVRAPYMLDTLSMARPKHGLTVGGSLKALAQHYGIGEKGTEVVAAMGKRLEDFTADELAQYGEYCKNDVELTYQLFQILKNGFPRSEARIVDMMLRMYTEPVLQFDRAILEGHLAKVRGRKEELIARVEAGKDDLMSNQKFAEVLRSLGVDPPMKANKKGILTYAFAKTDPGLVALLDHDSPEVQALVAARLGVKSTLEETRTEAFIGVADRGPLPILLNYYGGHTGRASGGDKINLQNLPRGGALRKAICAPEGHVLVVGDSAQIEARVVAWLAGQADLVSDFADKVDIYSKFASNVYGREITKKKDPTERHVGKTCILGLGYGMGSKKFQATLAAGIGGPKVNIEDSQADEIVALYRRLYSRIPILWRTAHRMIDAIYCESTAVLGPNDLIRADKDGVYLPNGMMLRYPELSYNGKEYSYKNRREAVKIFGGKLVENIVQALARIVVFNQMLDIHKRYRVALTVHDEIVAVVPEDEAETGKAFMEEVMSTHLPGWATGLPVSCEVGFHRQYGLAKA